MANLTEEHGLRKLVSIEQFNKESAVKKEPGIVGRLVRWLFGDTGGSSQQPTRLTEDQVPVLNELELGTQVGLRREEWDDYRVMIVDQRLRVLPITGLQTITSDFQCDVVVDVNVAYKVMDVNYVAFGVEDPLKMLQDKVIDLVLEAISKIPVIDLLKNQNNIASLIKNLGRIPETGLEVMDARVNIVPPHEVLDQIGRATKALIDAEAMIKEKEAKANVLERIDKTDFDSEERRVKNEASLRALQDSFEQAREIKGLVHAQTKEEKDANFKRRQALADEEHRLTILNKRLDAYAGVLERVGVNPKLAILMMDDTPWRLFFERFQSIGEEHNSQRLETIHEQINTLITTKQLPDESIAKLMDLLEEESKNLGGRPSIMKQFESFLEDSNSTPRLADSSIPKTEAGPETAIEHEYDNDAQRNIEEKIEDATSNHDDDTQSKLSQFERLYYERSPQSLNEARLIGQELLQTATLSVIDRTRIREYMKKIDDAISK